MHSRVVVVLITLLLLVGCASVPPEAAELSSAVGQRISAVQAANENLLASYFDLSKTRIEDFLRDRWVPAYLENYVRDAKLMDLLDAPEPLSDEDLRRLEEELQRTGNLTGDARARAVLAVKRALGDSNRGEIVLEFAEAGLRNIELQRHEMLDPVDAQKKAALASLRTSYAELIEMQTSVTAFIRSVQKEREAEDRVLKRLGVLDERDKAVDEAIKFNDQIVSATAQGKDALETAETIKKLVAEHDKKGK